MLKTFSVMISVSLLTVSSARVFAQARPDSREASEPTVLACALTQCILGATVRDAPFSAEAITVWRPRAADGRDEISANARYYRDSKGRIRVEQNLVGRAGGPHRVIVMPDADNERVYLLDPDSRTRSLVRRSLAQMMVGAGGGHLFVLPLSPTHFWTFYQVPEASLDSGTAAGVESLGQRFMAGLPTTGTRFTTTLPIGVIGSGHAERWVSQELKQVVFARSEDSEIGIVEYHLTKISRAEPRAELFDVPEDYTESPVKFPWTWQNPYYPALSRSAGR